ncbi:hypothetical protein GCM10023324_31170 [Streptomyces youssoufiensis]
MGEREKAAEAAGVGRDGTEHGADAHGAAEDGVADHAIGGGSGRGADAGSGGAEAADGDRLRALGVPKVPDVNAPICPSRLVLEHVTSRWGVLALAALWERTHRFSELRRRVGGVSEKMLAQTLQTLERDGFVHREAYPVIPPRVEYSLTPLGEEAAQQVWALARWSERRVPEVQAAREQYDARRSDSTRAGAEPAAGRRAGARRAPVEPGGTPHPGTRRSGPRRTEAAHGAPSGRAAR